MPWGWAAAGIAAAVSAYGEVSSSQAQAQSAKFNAQVSENNAAVAQQNALWAAQAGNAQAEQKQLETRSKVGGIMAAEAASGVDVNSGSAVDVRSSASELGELDAINIRSNAARTAYGYNNQSTSYQNQSQLDNFQAANDQTSGYISGAATLIGGAGKSYANWSSNNGLDTAPTTDATPAGSSGRGDAYPSY